MAAERVAVRRQEAAALESTPSTWSYCLAGSGRQPTGLRSNSTGMHLEGLRNVQVCGASHQIDAKASLDAGRATCGPSATTASWRDPAAQAQPATQSSRRAAGTAQMQTAGDGAACAAASKPLAHHDQLLPPCPASGFVTILATCCARIVLQVSCIHTAATVVQQDGGAVAGAAAAGPHTQPACVRAARSQCCH